MSCAGATRTFSTGSPLISMPRMADAFSRASAGPAASFTPPALPRPPACTCALMTTRPPRREAIASASSGVAATSPPGTGIPCARKISLAWYSWMFTASPPLPASVTDRFPPRNFPSTSESRGVPISSSS